MKRKRWVGLAAVLVALSIVGCVVAEGCATMDIPLPSPIPTTPTQRQQIEDGLGLAYTLYLLESIKESEWLTIKAAYDEYRTALIELKAQHERAKAGEPVDLSAYSSRVVSALTDFWLAQRSAVGVGAVTSPPPTPPQSAVTGGE